MSRSEAGRFNISRWHVGFATVATLALLLPWGASAVGGRFKYPRGHANGSSDLTKVYDSRGKLVGTLGDGIGLLADDSGEIWATDGPRGVIYVGITHTTEGGAVRTSRWHWRAWKGRRLMGTIVQRDRRRADAYSRTGRKTGRAIGAYPAEAAAVYVILGPF